MWYNCVYHTQHVTKAPLPRQATSKSSVANSAKNKRYLGKQVYDSTTVFTRV